MPGGLSTVAMLDETGNNTNITDTSSPVIPGGVTGYVRTYDLFIIGAAGVLLLSAVMFTWWRCHRCYRKKRDYEVEQAGNIQIRMSRPNLKK